MRNCMLQAISPFLTMFSTAMSLVCQNTALCGNGLTLSQTTNLRTFQNENTNLQTLILNFMNFMKLVESFLKR